MPCWWNWRWDLIDRRKCVTISRADPWNREESKSYIVAPEPVNGDEAVKGARRVSPPGNRSSKKNTYCIAQTSSQHSSSLLFSPNKPHYPRNLLPLHLHFVLRDSFYILAVPIRRESAGVPPSLPRISRCTTGRNILDGRKRGMVRQKCIGDRLGLSRGAR